MEKRSVQAILQAFDEAKVRYLIVGGLAVVAHGYLRFTADMDLVLNLREDNVRRALGALAGQGYRPQAPVPLEQFADPVIRAQWIREKGLTVFSLSSPAHSATAIDLFVEEPFDFESAYAAAIRVEVTPTLTVPVVSLDELICLKKKAGRPKDLEDIRRLEDLRKDFDSGSREPGR